jgi:CTP synthase
MKLTDQRKGDYLGKTVQIVPHLTNAVQDWIERVSKMPVDETGEEPDVCIVEVSYHCLLRFEADQVARWNRW